MSWQDSIFFEKGEKLVSSWEGNQESVEKRVIYGTTPYVPYKVREIKKLKRGILALTSQRLLFLEAHGVFGKSYHQTLSIPLAKLGEVSVGGTFIPFVSIADDVQNYVFHIDGIRKNEFSEFRRRIMDCCQKRREELEAEKGKSVLL
jgi:hypothetical protein